MEEQGEAELQSWDAAPHGAALGADVSAHMDLQLHPLLQQQQGALKQTVYKRWLVNSNLVHWPSPS